MTIYLYKQILRDDLYLERVTNIIDFDEVIDHLISKNIINEKEYLKIWRDANTTNKLFKILNTKRDSVIQDCFNVFKALYGDGFDVVLKNIRKDILDYIHLNGGFPKINSYIPRIQEETKIKEKFDCIRWNNSLVVYGRVGEGKSYLVSQCLNDEELIWKYFQNRLFWINVGECENDSNILQPLTRLLQMVAPKKKKMYDLDKLIIELQDQFKSKKNMQSLVILDNARSLEVIEHFQKINCKLIIITHFKTVHNAEFVEISSGFTLNETISLFAQYLKIDIEYLNKHFLDDIKDIHELCKGHPSTLTLLGVILSYKKESALDSKDLWNDIKGKIDKGEMDDLTDDDAGIIRRNFCEALRMCIDTIKTAEMKELYYQFAVFPKDTNISTEVLEVFWGKKPKEVWDIMQHFENRSLINSFYNINKKVYIYGIHDLFLVYLKNETRALKKKFHQKLIASYEDRYELHKLPDDNYILLFLGYHLKQADMIDKFENFLDLRFIEHKIRIVGVNNMEQDLKLYGEEIVSGNPKRKEKLDMCLEFIKDNKNELQQLQKTDIIQLALPTLKDEAQTLMVKNQANSINKLYFTRKLSAGRLKSSQEIFMKDVTAMEFCTDNNVSKILIGLNDGNIILYCSQTNKTFDMFQGHTESVFEFKVERDNSCFMSISKDGTVKLWQFFSQRLSFDGIDDLPTSPKCVQNEYFHAFGSGRRNNFKDFTYWNDDDYLVSANFSNNYSESKMICTGTNNGSIILWDAHAREKLFITIETGFPAKNTYFSCDDSQILFIKQDKIQFYKLENASNQLNYLNSINNSEDVIKLFVPNENTLIAVGVKYVMMYKFPFEDDSSGQKVYESTDNIACSSIAKGEYFAIGIKENVFLFSVSTGMLIETFEHNKVVTSISMDITRDDDNTTTMILMNFNDSIHQCNIMMQHSGQPRNKQDLVTSFWKNKNLPMLALVLNDNILKIKHEFNIINEVTIPHRITFITFSLCGNNIIYSLENGNVIEYQYKRQGSYKTLMILNCAIKYLQCLKLESDEENSLFERCYNSSDSENGAVVAITDGYPNIHILLGNGQLNHFLWDFPIFKVFPMPFQQLLCIDKYASAFIIDVLKSNKDIQVISYAAYQKEVSAAAFCSNTDTIAITFINENSKKNHVELINIRNKTSELLNLQFAPKCCTFSYLGGLLAVGSDDGKIMVCNLQNKYKCEVLNNTGLSIKFVQFAQTELPILVAVGREISWWNLSSFEDDHNNGNCGPDNTDFDLCFWKNKTIHNEIPYLLQIVGLYSNAVHFSVSKNFETFLVVDDESRIYVLNVLKMSNENSESSYFSISKYK
ncbi:hypothetical protein WA026_019952 [Henosepilachna vigintioctopunctata]|uniref:Apoptotic protease-activating factor 1 n=1 Tax=Henosepilachna vigintioctopunctata TaxID=420089 RepID=A0AAW1V410_9CUCU